MVSIVDEVEDLRRRVTQLERNQAGIQSATTCGGAGGAAVFTDTKSALEPGDGYRLLSLGDKLEPGDQFLEHNGTSWSDTAEAGKLLVDSGCSGRTVGIGNGYRRKLQYRLLNVGEAVEGGDEYWDSPSGGWRKTVRDSGSVVTRTDNPYRRVM